MSKEMEKKNMENQSPDQQTNPAGQNDSNIQLTVLRPKGDTGEMSLDLYEIGGGLKRFLALWLALAIALGAITFGLGALLRHGTYGGNVRSVIEFTIAELADTVLDGTESKTERAAKLAKVENISANLATDLSMMQTGEIVEQAMRNVGVDIHLLDDVREGLIIESIMSSDAYNRQSLYYKLVGSNSGQEMLDTLLGKTDPILRYLVSLDYSGIKIDRETAVLLLNEIIMCYRRYFEQSNNTWSLPGSAVKSVDFTTYDYAEAVSVFRNQTDGIRDWIQQNIVLRMTGDKEIRDGSSFTQLLKKYEDSLISDFRAVSTGYTLRDLYDREELLRNTSLNSAAAFINMNAVTSRDVASQISYYNWLIDTITQQRTTAQTRYNSLRNSVANYKKDPVVYTSMELSEQRGSSQSYSATDAYDKMILQMVDLEEEIAGYSTSIRYYESLVAKMEEKATMDQTSRDRAEAMMTTVNDEINTLSAAMDDTMQEYREKAVKGNALTILVPAVAHKAGLLEGRWLKLALGIEAVLFLGWLVAGVGYGMKQANPRKKRPAVKENAPA